ncbi:hypothetical protein B0J14DRAFT_207194 [Halenospora varia]|nr:hypothetical protein B0J14DRAFT_207194 [Halenospora varia]
MDKDSTSATFTYFQQLPKEIRLQVWETAQPDRILPFHVDVERYGQQMRESESWPKICCRAPPLNLLSINHESRTHTLKFYTLVSHNFLVSRFYFNSHRDTLYLAEHWYESEPITLIESVARCNASHKVRSFAVREHAISHYLFAQRVKKIADFDEIFLIVDEEAAEPMKTLLPRTSPIVEPGDDDPDFSRLFRRNRLVEAFELLRDLGNKLPRLMIVREDYWVENGLRLRGGEECVGTTTRT